LAGQTYLRPTPHLTIEIIDSAFHIQQKETQIKIKKGTHAEQNKNEKAAKIYET
jgi:hypothetical protein